MFFLIFIAKKTTADGILFSILRMPLIFTENFIFLKSSFLANSLSAFVILAG